MILNEFAVLIRYILDELVYRTFEKWLRYYICMPLLKQQRKQKPTERRQRGGSVYITGEKKTIQKSAWASFLQCCREWKVCSKKLVAADLSIRRCRLPLLLLVVSLRVLDTKRAIKKS